jgi:hypothetical protein
VRAALRYNIQADDAGGHLLLSTTTTTTGLCSCGCLRTRLCVGRIAACGGGAVWGGGGGEEEEEGRALQDLTFGWRHCSAQGRPWHQLVSSAYCSAGRAMEALLSIGLQHQHYPAMVLITQAR